MDKWEFKKIFNIYNEQINKHSLTYYIKWKYYNKKTWEFEKSLKGCKYILFKFYKKHLKKLRLID